MTLPFTEAAQVALFRAMADIAQKYFDYYPEGCEFGLARAAFLGRPFGPYALTFRERLRLIGLALFAGTWLVYGDPLTRISLHLALRLEPAVIKLGEGYR